MKTASPLPDRSVLEETGGKAGGLPNVRGAAALDYDWLWVGSAMIRQAQWCDRAAMGLSRALPPQTLHYVGREVCRGISQLWECSSDPDHAWCVTRIDRNPTTLVIVAFEGTGIVRFAPPFIEAARARRLPIRAHTVSRGMARLLERRLQFQLREYLLIREA